MNQDVLDYPEKERVGVLAVAMPDGSVHAATVHFALRAEPFALLVGTGMGSMKGKALAEAGELKASCVVGADEETMITAQADGVIGTVGAEDQPGFDEIYLGKLP